MSVIVRKTAETDIRVDLKRTADAVAGTGAIDTGVPFLDHMLAPDEADGAAALTRSLCGQASRL